jgi:hypothetical protein
MTAPGGERRHHRRHLTAGGEVMSAASANRARVDAKAASHE